MLGREERRVTSGVYGTSGMEVGSAVSENDAVDVVDPGGGGGVVVDSSVFVSVVLISSVLIILLPSPTPTTSSLSITTTGLLGPVLSSSQERKSSPEVTSSGMFVSVLSVVDVEGSSTSRKSRNAETEESV